MFFLEEEEEEEDVVEVEELGFWQMNSFWDIFIAQVHPNQKKKKEVVQLLTQLWFWIGVHTSYIIDCNYGTSRIYNLLNIVFSIA